jgi:hypothetical protein
MNWIKANYDRLLLGVFGIMALLIGLLLSFKAFTAAGEAEETVPKGEVTDRYNPGEYLTANTQASLKSLSSELKWTPVKMGAHDTARLLTSTPIVEKSGETPVPILAENSKPLREGVPNWWLFQNGLPLVQDNVLQEDTDGDGYENKLEFEGGSDPRNPKSMPKWHAKVRFAELVKDPYKIKFNTIIDKDIQLRRTAPNPVGKLNYHVGDEAFDDDKRLKIVSVGQAVVEGSNPPAQVNVLTIEDKVNPVGSPFTIKEKEEVDRPTLRAKLRSLFDNEEVTVREGEQIKLKAFPNIQIKLLKINEDSIEVEFYEPGKPAEKAKIALAP